MLFRSVIIQHVDNKAFIKPFLEAGTWSDAIMCGCEQFEVVEVDYGDNFSHLERFYQKNCIILYDVLPMFAIGELYKSFHSQCTLLLGLNTILNACF